MLRLVIQRIAGLVPILIVVSFAVFLLLSLVPGDPAITLASAGGDPTPEQIERVREQYHLDDPMLVQYGRWAWGAVQLDFGESAVDGKSVMSEVRFRMPMTVTIAVSAVVVALLIGIPFGVAAGLRPHTRFDRVARLVTIAGVSIPNFWLAILFIVLFAVRLAWLPSGGYTSFFDSPTDWAKHLVLPALTLGIGLAGIMQRQLRAALVDVLGSKYIQAAWARGGTAWGVVGRHGLKNAAIAPLTVLGVQAGYMVGGSVIVEQIFSIPGVGTYMLRAILNRDLAVVQGCTFVFVLTTVSMSLLVDIIYGVLNPKVRGA